MQCERACVIARKWILRFKWNRFMFYGFGYLHHMIRADADGVFPAIRIPICQVLRSYVFFNEYLHWIINVINDYFSGRLQSVITLDAASTCSIEFRVWWRAHK